MTYLELLMAINELLENEEVNQFDEIFIEILENKVKQLREESPDY